MVSHLPYPRTPKNRAACWRMGRFLDARFHRRDANGCDRDGRGPQESPTKGWGVQWRRSGRFDKSMLKCVPNYKQTPRDGAENSNL
jgi:hypothetical protein